MKKLLRRLLCLVLFFCVIPNSSFAYSITHGPYLQELSDSGVTIMWLTDKPEYGSVEYGEGGSLNMKAEETQNGILKVGKLHSVRLSGLKEGQEYSYKVHSTEVIDHSPLFPTIGGSLSTPVKKFKTFNKYKQSFSFFCVTDIHSSISDLNKYLGYTDWNETDFLAMTGDVLDDFSAKDSARIYSIVLDPCVDKFAKEKPFLFVRGNHEMRGSLGPNLFKYFPHTKGEWFYSFYQGPAYFYVFDTGEDKKDESVVLGGLIRCEDYREKQKKWFKEFSEANKAFTDDFPIKIVFAHDPNWGYGSNYDELANDAGISLLIGGHTHYYSHTTPNNSKNFHRLVIGRYMSAKITVTGTTEESIVDVTVFGSNGNVHDSFQIVKGGMVNNKSSINVSNKGFKFLNNSFKLNGNILNLPKHYNNLKKEIKIFSLNGKLLHKIITSKQTIHLTNERNLNMPVKGISLVKVRTIK